MTTIEAYDQVLARCERIFQLKNEDYGTSWTILRSPSLTDQMYIKAARIRSIQQTGEQLVADDIKDDYLGLINYGFMYLIQQARASADYSNDFQHLFDLYAQEQNNVRALMLKKNHDYGEAWRSMRLSSMTDLALTKLLRIKSIEDQDGLTRISESAASNVHDIINYAVFSVILLNEQE